MYLSYFNKPGWIKDNQYSYNNDYLPNKEKLPIPADTLNLIKRYFMDWFKNKNIEPSFIIFKCFKKMLFQAFKTFSDSPYFWRANFEGLDAQFKLL